MINKRNETNKILRDHNHEFIPKSSIEVARRDCKTVTKESPFLRRLLLLLENPYTLTKTQALTILHAQDTDQVTRINGDRLKFTVLHCPCNSSSLALSRENRVRARTRFFDRERESQPSSRSRSHVIVFLFITQSIQRERERERETMSEEQIRIVWAPCCLVKPDRSW